MYLTPFTAYLSVTRLSGGALPPNSSETAWNFKTPFYRMGTGTLWMVYVILYKSISFRDLSGRVGFGGSCGGGGGRVESFLPNFSKMVWTFQTPFFGINTDSLRMVNVYFQRPISHRDFAMTILFQGYFWYFWYFFA